MKRKQEANDHISVCHVVILPVIIIVISLFFISLGSSNSHNNSSHFLQNAVAMNTNTTLANTTGKAGSETAESLVRSLMDPTSLMTSVINQTGGSTTNTTNSTESAQLKKPITADNISNAIGGALSTQSKIISTTTPPPKNGNTTPITTTSSSPSSLPPHPSATSQSNNATLISPAQPTSAQAATTTNTTTTMPSTENINNNKQQNITQTTVVRNIATLLLAHQIVPPKDFIHIYDTTPYNILNGHLVAKIPCDANSAPSLQILIGHLPDLKPVQPQLIKEFSKPGYICMYNVDIGSPTMTTTSYGSNTDKGDNVMNTDLVLRNPTDYRITLPSTSTVVIGVNEIVPLPTMDNPSHPEETKGQINNIINDMNTSTTMPK